MLEVLNLADNKFSEIDQGLLNAVSAKLTHLDMTQNQVDGHSGVFLTLTN